jgi:hypothetical protein
MVLPLTMSQNDVYLYTYHQFEWRFYDIFKDFAAQMKPKKINIDKFLENLHFLVEKIKNNASIYEEIRG